MPRAAGLTAAKVRTAAPGRYGDGGGLYLFVKPPVAKHLAAGERDGGKFWLFRYTPTGGKLREMGLGPASGRDAISLADARERATEARRLHKAGIDPLARRHAEAAGRKAEEQRAAAAAVTFKDVADLYIAAHEAGWRNPKHAAQWRATLVACVFPIFGALPVADVDTPHVMKALEPIWTEKPETASRVRGRIEAVLDYAKARGWRSGENPARWRGHVENMLPARSKVATVTHHAALPWPEIGAFMAALAQREPGGVAALALRFVILTAARSGEALGARWSEIDLDAKIWTVPAARMKAGREHRVPLSPAALAVLGEVAGLRTGKAGDAFVFPGQRPTRPLSGMAMSMLLRRMNREDITVHGFRSTFRDWCSEATAFDRDTAEAALAHTLRDKVEAAYRRGDQMEKRRRLMEAWGEFCARPAAEGATVTPIRAAG
jgi:integrase